MRSFRLECDILPNLELNSRSGPNDYLDLSLGSLLYRSAGDLVSEVKRRGDAFHLTLAPARNHLGQPVAASECCAQIERATQQHHFGIKSVAVLNANEILMQYAFANQQLLLDTLKRPGFRLPGFFGPYYLARPSELLPNEHHPFWHQEELRRLLLEPGGATCPSSFDPLNSDNPDFEFLRWRLPLTMFARLGAARPFSLPEDEAQIVANFPHGLRKARRPFTPTNSREGQLLFADYHPNRLVAQSLEQKLRHHGGDIRLQNVDYRQFLTTEPGPHDIKLSLLASHGEEPFFFYYNLLTSDLSPQQKTALHKILVRYAQSDVSEAKQELVAAMEQELAQQHPFVAPLMHMTSTQGVPKEDVAWWLRLVAATGFGWMELV